MDRLSGPMAMRYLLGSIAGATGLLLLMAAAPAALGAPASAMTGPHASAETAWAYGANYSGSASWTNSTGGYTATLNAFFGWHTILNQSAGPNGTVRLEAQRTVALDYTLAFCKPSCGAASVSGNVTFRAWQTAEAFATLTPNGTAYVNGSPVHALALVNDSTHVTGNVTETVTGTVHSLLSVRTVSYYFSVQATADTAVQFSPALGLVPAVVGPGLVWNSSSVFTASGAWSAQYAYVHVPMMGPPKELMGPISGSVEHNGSVALTGEDLGHLTLNDGSATDVLALGVVGPFHVVEGLMLVPATADVFGGSGTAWGGYQNDTGAVATDSLNFGARAVHLGLLASATSYVPQASSPSSLSTLASPVGGIAPAAVPASGAAGGAVVQGQPESVPAAEQGSACLVSGTCVTPPSPISPVPRGTAGLLVIGLVVVGVIAAAVLVTQRRRIPPPTHPNAGLYPVEAAAPAPRPPRPPTAPSESEDPLGHLW